MMTIAQAFHTLTQSLELTDAERSEAQRQQNVLRDNLRKHLGGVERDILSGSYSRGTAIRPLHDIDIFVILDKQYHRDVYPSAVGESPERCLARVQEALEKAYPNKSKPRRQRRSVHVDMLGTGIGYDVVPAFEVRGGVFMIPDVDRKGWINTNPEGHKEKLELANRRAGSKLNSLIKLAKLWKRRQREQTPDFALRSFHLEVMAYSAFPAPPPSYPAGLRTLFEHVAAVVRLPCPDPSGAGPNIDQGVDQQERDKVCDAARAAADQARRALTYEEQGRHEEAHSLWRDLLGPDYPERGRPMKP